MNLRSLIGIATAAGIIFTYSIQSPALAYRSGGNQVYEAKDGRNVDQRKRKENQEKKEEEKKNQDQNNNNHKNKNNNQQNNEDKNKKDHDDDDQNQNHDQKKDHQNKKDKKHDHDHDQNQNDQDHHDHDKHHKKHNHHGSWHDDDPNPVLIIGLLLFQEMHERSESRRVLRRTANVLERAQIMARQDNDGHHHRYGLGRAFSHQRWALELFRSGRYQQAAFHSLRARNIALRIIRRIEREADWDERQDGCYREDEDFDCEDIDRNEYDDAEVAYMESCPSESELSVELDQWYISDDEALNIRIEMNF